MRRARRARARATVATGVAALAATPLITGCGTASKPVAARGVALVPAPAAGRHTWRWTGRCPLRPVAGGGCAKGGPILGSAQLNGDGWNLGGPAKAGALDMSVGSGGAVTIDGRFAQTAPCTASTCLAPSAYTWVRGYPNVLYGIDQCNARTSPPPSRRLPLPMRLDSLPPHLTGVTAYSAHTSDVTYDVTYDLWLHPSATKRPCRTQGTLEILVWTDYDARALLPAGMQVGTATIPSAVDGVARPGSRTWAIYASNVFGGGRTQPWGGTLWFVPAATDVVHSGRVSVDLSAVLSAAGRLLRDNYGWAPLGARYWLDTASFGIEFGPPGGEPLDTGPSRFSLRLSTYCLDAATALADACMPAGARARG